MTTTYEDAIVVDYTVIPDSSFIDGLAYDAENHTAYVVIDGCAYTYVAVPYSAYVELATAESVGHEYHSFSRVYGPSSPIWDAAFTLRTEECRVYVDPEVDALIDNVEAEKNVSVAMNSIDPVAEAVWQRREGLELAIKIHAGTAQDDNIVLDTAEAFRKYLNG